MKLTLKSLLFIALIWFSGLAVFNYYIRAYPLDTSTKTDAIVVLTGGSNRIKEAVNLLNSGLSDVLLISGVEKKTTLNSILKTIAVTPAPNKKIVIEHASTNTVENAIEANDWIQKNNIKSIRLVTSNYHLPRSKLEFEIQNKGLDIVVNPVFSENVSPKWWRYSGTFSLMASEYNKFLLVYLKHLLINWAEG